MDRERTPAILPMMGQTPARPPRPPLTERQVDAHRFHQFHDPVATEARETQDVASLQTDARVRPDTARSCHINPGGGVCVDLRRPGDDNTLVEGAAGRTGGL
jgi:hypothetical protein